MLMHMIALFHKDIHSPIISSHSLTDLDFDKIWNKYLKLVIPFNTHTLWLSFFQVYLINTSIIIQEIYQTMRYLQSNYVRLLKDLWKSTKLGCGSKFFESFPQMWHHFYKLALLKPFLIDLDTLCFLLLLWIGYKSRKKCRSR